MEKEFEEIIVLIGLEGFCLKRRISRNTIVNYYLHFFFVMKYKINFLMTFAFFGFL